MTKPDCELGFGYNAKLKISDIANRAPEYFKILYKSDKTPIEIKEVMKHYITEKEKPMAKAKEKVEKTESAENIENIENLGLLKKINLIRKACAEKCIEKEGKGKAGGGSKYDYYKAQQVIDFYLDEEIKYDLFSEFKVTDTIASYRVIDIPTGEITSVECPFDIPRKMAASEAQQVGAALTYYNRRLAMMMYKIEDNSKESEDILGDADFSAKEIPAPVIPAPPIIMPPPATVATAAKVDKIVDVEPMTDKEVDELIHEQEVKAQEEVKEVQPTKRMTPPAPPTPPVMPNVTGLANGQTPYVDPKALMSKGADESPTPVVTPPITPVSAPKTNIEALYD